MLVFLVAYLFPRKERLLKLSLITPYFSVDEQEQVMMVDIVVKQGRFYILNINKTT